MRQELRRQNPTSSPPSPMQELLKRGVKRMLAQQTPTSSTKEAMDALAWLYK